MIRKTKKIQVRDTRKPKKHWIYQEGTPSDLPDPFLRPPKTSLYYNPNKKMAG